MPPWFHQGKKGGEKGGALPHLAHAADARDAVPEIYPGKEGGKRKKRPARKCARRATAPSGIVDDAPETAEQPPLWTEKKKGEEGGRDAS